MKARELVWAAAALVGLLVFVSGLWLHSRLALLAGAALILTAHVALPMDVGER